MRILIVGSGGREHALAWACAQRGDVQLLCAPGNGGTANLAENVAIAATDAAAIAELASARDVEMVVVGPDAALAAGVVDACNARGIAAFGPTAAAAQLESSKAFAKEVMAAAGIATAAFVVANHSHRDAALRFIREHDGRCVVKADGLALGKGVSVCFNRTDAEAALAACLDGAAFGSAGEIVVVEELLSGREVSVFALCDGERARLLPPACDYKRAFDGDRGPNTGGMGAYTPPLDLDSGKLLTTVAKTVVDPCLAEMRRRGTPFRGCLYVGLMLDPRGLRVLEFNARFGDPETQALLPILDEDIVELLIASASGRIESGRVATRAAASVCVVGTTAEYPETGSVGLEVEVATPAHPDTLIFQAGTRTDARFGPHGLSVAGGRVINLVGHGQDVATARGRAYAGLSSVEFAGMRYRNDIAARLAVAAPDTYPTNEANS